MREDFSNIDFLSIEVDCRNKSVFVTADVKDNKTINVVSTAKVLFQFAERLVICLFYNTIPIVEGRLAIGIFLDKRFNSFMCNDVHVITRQSAATNFQIRVEDVLNWRSAATRSSAGGWL